MATIFGSVRRARPLATDRYERGLAWGAMILLGFVIVALLKGRAHWAMVSPMVWGHLLAITIALALTPIMLLRVRGDTVHRRIGRMWVAAMIVAALFSLFVRDANHGGFSFIHILSAWVLVQVPLIAWTAHTHRVSAHRQTVRGMVTGALLIAGFFTFPFDRLLGQWLAS